MSTTCLNCGHHFTGKYCPNCGQKASVKRLTPALLLADVLHFFTHFEKGFFFTTWSFLTKPGISSACYISGKRKQFQSPGSYFLIWTGLYIILHDAIVNHFGYILSGEVITQLDKSGEANRQLQGHFTLFIIPAVFCSALIIYFVLARPKFNFTELLALSLYSGGTYFMMLFISDIVLGTIFKVNVLNAPVFLWQISIDLLYSFWFSYHVFKRDRLRLFWLRLICATLLVAISGWIIIFYLPIAWIYLTKLSQ